MKTKIIIFVFCFFLFIPGLIFAQESLPGAGFCPDQPFYYFLEKVKEGLQSFFTFGKVARAERYLGFASERVAEIDLIIKEKDLNLVLEPLERYVKLMEKEEKYESKAREKEKDVSELLEKTLEATLTHQEVFVSVYDKVPQTAKEEIKNALEKSLTSHQIALEALSFEKQEKKKEEQKERLKKVSERMLKLKKEGEDLPDVGLPKLKSQQRSEKAEKKKID